MFKFSNKGFSTVIGIVIIILIVVVLGGGILAWHYLMVPKTPTLTPTSTLTSGTTPTSKNESPKVVIQEGKINEALSICGKIKDTQQRNICIGIVNGNSEACEVLPDYQKLSCYVSLGRRIGNSSICERFKNEGFKYECLAMLNGNYDNCKKSVDSKICYYDVALINKDSSGCSKITDNFDNSDINKCLAYTKRDASYCKNISQGTVSDDCYINVAMLTNNSSICQKATTHKDLCQSMVARNIGSLNCGEYGGYCEFLAGFTGSTSVCQKMANADYCYHDAAMGLLGIYPPEEPTGW